MNLGEHIYRLRTERNLSQGDLADALEVSRQSVSKWENNSAVPELDKLIRLAQIFGITIDELVTGVTAEATPPAPREEPATAYKAEEPRVIYIEKPVRPLLTSAQILGIILTACSVLALMLSLVLVEPNNWWDSPFVLCIPVAVWGILCMVTKHPLLWCGWCGCIIYWIFLMVLSSHWEDAVGIIVGVLLVAAVLLYTIWLHRKGTIHVEAWVWAALTLVLSAFAILLCINLIQLAEGTVTVTPPQNITDIYP